MDDFEGYILITPVLTFLKVSLPVREALSPK